jgi:uncharacterized protein YbjT (DUF2867 family)
MQKPILITGASGTIGSFLVENLLAKEKPIRLALRDSRKSPYHQSAVSFDYRDDKSMQNALEGIEQVFWLTPSPIQVKKEEAFDELEVASRFIDHMKQAGVQHIVRISGMGADLYKESAHFRIEELIRASGIAYTILRPAFFMQIFSVYYRNSIQKHDRIDLYDGGVRESFVDARDIAAVAAESFLNPQHRNQIYTLTSNDLLNYKDIAEILTKVLGRSIRYIAKSDEDSIQALLSSGWTRQAAEPFVMLLQAVQQGAFSIRTDDVKRVLGREPITFVQYAEDHVSIWSKSTQQEKLT